MTDDLYEEVETGSFENFKHGGTPTVRIEGISEKNTTSTRVALSVREVDGPGSSLEFVGLKKNEFWKFRLINKAMGFKPADMREAASACAPIPSKEDPDTAPIPMECAEAWVSLWSQNGTAGQVFTYYRNRGDKYPKVEWGNYQPKDYDEANGPDEIPI